MVPTAHATTIITMVKQGSDLIGVSMARAAENSAGQGCRAARVDNWPIILRYGGGRNPPRRNLSRALAGGWGRRVAGGRGKVAERQDLYSQGHGGGIMAEESPGGRWFGDWPSVPIGKQLMLLRFRGRIRGVQGGFGSMGSICPDDWPRPGERDATHEEGAKGKNEGGAWNARWSTDRGICHDRKETCRRDRPRRSWEFCREGGFHGREGRASRYGRSVQSLAVRSYDDAWPSFKGGSWAIFRSGSAVGDSTESSQPAASHSPPIECRLSMVRRLRTPLVPDGTCDRRAIGASRGSRYLLCLAVRAIQLSCGA